VHRLRYNPACFRAACDRILFSYSLMPAEHAILRSAYNLLSPGGKIPIADFDS
jgi:hypothetical protein